MKLNKTLLVVVFLLSLVLMLQGKGDNLCLMAVGDIMPGTNYPSERYLPVGDGSGLVSHKVRGQLLGADILCGNLEGCFLDAGEPSERKKGKFLFRIPEKLGSVLTFNGFDLLSLANNHAGDFGDEGRYNTQRVLDSLGIEYAGFLEKPAAIIEHDDYRVGFLALAPFRGCLSDWQRYFVEAIIDSLSLETDLIIASIHYGGEGEDFLHIKNEDEIYMGENRGNPVAVAHWLVDCGVDLINGHGPHVPRAMELYKGRLIAYSLGNFITWGRFYLEGEYRPLAPVLQVYYDKEGNFIYGNIISCRQNYEQGVDIDADRKAAQVLQELSETDFPGTKLRFLVDKRGFWFYGI
ncbi:MAG: CapA family protein [Candidatus Cloacimonetes bacterium]|nr:CapA family protein [Candidatus Cloacimonadota bacterium]